MSQGSNQKPVRKGEQQRQSQESPAPHPPVEERAMGYLLALHSAANSEVEKVQGAWTRWASGVGVMAAVGLAIGGFLFYNSLSDFKREFRAEGTDLINLQLASITNTIGDQLRLATNHIGKEVTRLIYESFETSSISNLVATQANDRLDRIADAVIKREVDRLVSDLKFEAAIGSNSISNSLASVDDRIRAFNEDADFIKVILKAQSGSRNAWESLLKISQESKNPRSMEAFTFYASIREDIMRKRALGLIQTIDDTASFKTNDFNMSRFLASWNGEAKSRFVAPAMVQFAAYGRNFDPVERLRFLSSVLTNSNDSIDALDIAYKNLAGKFGITNLFPYVNIEPLKLKCAEWLATNVAVAHPIESTPK